MRIHFLINPISAKKLSYSIEEAIREVFPNAGIDFSNSAGHLSALARELAQEQADVIVAVGGDGTVQRVGAELVGSISSLGIIPIGSGNGLARHLGISMDPRTALRQLQKGKGKRMDTLTVNGKVCLNLAGVGFDAHIAHCFADSSIRGFWTYVKIVIKEYLSYRSSEYQLKIDDNEQRIRAYFITLCNGSEYGNHALIAPQAKIDDGFIDVEILKFFRWWQIPSLAFRLFIGTLNRSSIITSYRCQKVDISGDRMEIHLDGDPEKSSKVLNCEINPRSLKFISVLQDG